MRVGLCQLVLSAVLLTIVSVRNVSAEPTPWFDDHLIKFPDALLLERAPTPQSVPPQTAPAPRPPEVVTPVSTVETAPELARAHEVVAPVSTSGESAAPQSAPAAVPEKACACSLQRRWIFAEDGYYSHCSACEYWQILPDGILYPSYIAGEKEPRMAFAVLNEKDRGAIFESTIGGRMGLLRYGTPGPINPQGWQWDLESAAMLRQDPEEELDVDAVDFRIGSVITWRRGATECKAGFYHLSSHVGDEFLERNPGLQRLNYTRDAVLIGVRQWITPELALYGEVNYGVRNDGGSEPLELQFGAEYTSWAATDPCGAPFAAVNAHLREEFDFGGAFNVLAGWEWRGPTSNRRLRIGGQYYTGKEIQWSFFEEDIQLSGVGIWYEF
jgi:hypothetical protein